MKDMWCWMNGRYVYEAIATVASNMMKKQGQQPDDYRDKPILSELKEKNRVLTEEEKQDQISLLFGNLERMKNNFERSHGE
jgi:hypothetical protein